MGWKCALQIKGLTLGEPKPGAKHKMNLRKATMEAGYERASRSDTLDRKRSHLNRYEGYMKGAECADAMEAKAEFINVTMKDGTVRRRKNRADAVPGFAVICNPPAEICMTWDDTTYDKFYIDSWECLCSYYPKIFRDENLVMRAEHWDEGIPPEDLEDKSQIDRHEHRIGYARDEDGRWCGNEIDAKFFVGLNAVFPQMMRERGWEMDDLDTTDFERAKSDSEYRAERNAKRARLGKSVNNHIKTVAEENLKQAEQILEEAETVHAIAANMLEEAEGADAYAADVRARAKREREDADAYARKKLKEGKKAISEAEEKKAEIEKATSKIRALQERITNFTNRLLKRLFSKSKRSYPVSEMDLEEKWNLIEAEFQEREDALEAQKAIITEQKRMFSPAEAAKFVLGSLKSKYQKAQRTEMVSSIALLEQQVKSGAAYFNRKYFAELRQHRISRENIKTAFDEIPEIQKEKPSDWQLGD